MLFDEAKLKQKLQEMQDHFQEEIKKIRTGRATKELFDKIMVEVYESQMPVTNCANVVIESAISVVLKVWDTNNGKAIEDALIAANIGGSVSRQAADTIRINFHPLTEEDRLEKVKELNRMLEDRKVKIRLVRQEFMEDLKKMDGVPEDDKKRDMERIQKIIDEAIKHVEDLSSSKESEIMKI